LLKKFVLSFTIVVLMTLSGCIAQITQFVDATPVESNTDENGENIAGTEPTVALTFDDGPSPQYTKTLLDGLRSRNVRATFFLIGSSIEGNEDIVRQMYEDGHQIGSHTYSHVQLTKCSVDGAIEEIEAANEAIYQACGEYPDYIRPPYGSWNDTLQEATNMNVVLWNVDPYDWKVQNKEQVVENVMRDVKDSSIILLHDIYKPSVEAALEIVDRLQEMGYRFATVEELSI
jgi:peptidoglycan/xylan/chitin deacetylase (PgdA/CDA1 family)